MLFLNELELIGLHSKGFQYCRLTVLFSINHFFNIVKWFQVLLMLTILFDIYHLFANS